MTLPLQEIFDNAVRGVYHQGGPAYDGLNEVCLYRQKMDDGTVRKCGIGHSIPDDRYHEEMESLGVTRLIEGFRLDDDTMVSFRDLLPADCRVQLVDLQQVHDNAAQEADGGSFVEGFLGEAWKFAQHNDLTWPEDVPRPD